LITEGKRYGGEFQYSEKKVDACVQRRILYPFLINRIFRGRLSENGEPNEAIAVLGISGSFFIGSIRDRQNSLTPVVSNVTSRRWSLRHERRYPAESAASPRIAKCL
jgi:hypothetical protein